MIDGFTSRRTFFGPLMLQVFDMKASICVAQVLSLAPTLSACALILGSYRLLQGMQASSDRPWPILAAAAAALARERIAR